MGLFADSYALGTVFSFASFIRAFNLNKKGYFTIRFFALNITNSIFWFLTAGMASGWLAYRFAYGGTFRIVALPSTLGVALQIIKIHVGW
jgi:hypothetical protein